MGLPPLNGCELVPIGPDAALARRQFDFLSSVLDIVCLNHHPDSITPYPEKMLSLATQAGG
jgi:hypothetical protein